MGTSEAFADTLRKRPALWKARRSGARLELASPEPHSASGDRAFAGDFPVSEGARDGRGRNMEPVSPWYGLRSERRAGLPGQADRARRPAKTPRLHRRPWTDKERGSANIKPCQPAVELSVRKEG